MLTSLKTIFISELILVFAMVAGIIPQEFSYLILFLLSVSFLKMKMSDSLKLFILSVPFFVALPANAFSDSMSSWRVLILVLFLKLCYEKLYAKNVGKSFSFLQIFKKGCQRVKKELSYLNKKSYYKLFILVSVFLFFTIVSLLFAQDISAGVKKILFFVNIILLFPITLYCLESEKDLINIIKYLFYSISIILFFGYFQFGLTFIIPLHDFWQFWSHNVIKVLYGENLSVLLSYSNTWFSYYSNLPPTLRMFSVMPDSHSFAMIVIISIPLLLVLLSQNIVSKRILIWTLILAACSIFFSGTRGIWVGLIMTLFVAMSPFFSYKFTRRRPYLVRTKKHNLDNVNSKIILYSIILFFIVAPISFFVLRQNQEMQLYKNGEKIVVDDKFNLFERVRSVTDFSEISNKGRLQIWKETVVSISDNTFFGVGYGNYPLVLNESLNNVKRGSSAHNIYLDIAAELGIFALLVFILLIVEVLSVCHRLFKTLSNDYLKTFAGSFFIYFFWISAYGLFDVVIFNDKVLMYLVVVIGLVYFVLENQKKLEL